MRHIALVQHKRQPPVDESSCGPGDAACAGIDDLPESVTVPVEEVTGPRSERLRPADELEAIILDQRVVFPLFCQHEVIDDGRTVHAFREVAGVNQLLLERRGESLDVGE